MQSLLLRMEISRALRRVAPTFATIVSVDDLLCCLRDMPESARAELAALLTPTPAEQRE